MKSCREIEQLLYLYDELTVAEKVLTDDHLQHCEACSKLFEYLKENKTLIQRAAQITAIPQNAGRLTANIMEAVQAKARKKRHGLAQWMENAWTKYLLAGASLMLVVLFIVEQQPASYATNLPVAVTPQSKTVTLNTSVLLEEVRKQRETRKHTTTISLYDCAKTNACENEIIKNFKLKKSS